MNTYNHTLQYLEKCQHFKENSSLLYLFKYMASTRNQQLGSQLRAARDTAGLSLRGLSAITGIPTMTLDGYEKGNKIPADKFLRIADALDHRVFDVDGQKFSVNRSDSQSRKTEEQMFFNFSGEYTNSRATVKIASGKITVAFNAANTVRKSRA